MWPLLLMTFFFLATASHADDDLFSDGQVAEIPIEYVDAGFQDDWSDIEQSGGGGGKTSIDAAPGLVIADTFQLFNSRDLWRKEKSISLMGGNETIASTYHVLIFPQARFEFLKFYGHLGVPLRFPVYDNVNEGLSGRRSRGFVSGETFITPRRQDFRSFADAQRIFRHMEMGEENGPYFFRASRLHSITLGQGELVRNLSPDGLYDQDLMFLSGHGEFDNGRISGFLAPLPKVEMFALATRLTPLYNLEAAPFVRNLNFDLVYVNDVMAPNQAIKKDNAYVLNDEQRLVDRVTGTAQGFSVGAASENFVLPWLSLKPYTSMGNLWLSGLKAGEQDLAIRYGAGLHVGHDATIYFMPGTKKSVLQFKMEGQIFSNRYWPGYFGPTYFIDRVVENEPSNTTISATPLTKSQYLGRHTDNYPRVGYLFEVAYAYEKIISGVLGYENARTFRKGLQIDPMRKLQFILGFVGLDLIKFHLGYQATQLAQMKELFDFEKSRALLSLRGQLKLAPFLYFDAWAKHSFGINDMYTPTEDDGADQVWLSHQAETRSLNFGVGLEFAMTF